MCPDCEKLAKVWKKAHTYSHVTHKVRLKCCKSEWFTGFLPSRSCHCNRLTLHTVHQIRDAVRQCVVGAFQRNFAWVSFLRSSISNCREWNERERECMRPKAERTCFERAYDNLCYLCDTHWLNRRFISQPTTTHNTVPVNKQCIPVLCNILQTFRSLSLCIIHSCDVMCTIVAVVCFCE